MNLFLPYAYATYELIVTIGTLSHFCVSIKVIIAFPSSAAQYPSLLYVIMNIH